MNQADNLSVKILFRFHSDVLDEVAVETLWATTIDPAKGHYKIDNIPFYVPSVSSGDIVFAEYDEAEEMLCYRHSVEFSGNSTIQVILMELDVDISDIRQAFVQLGCESESLSENYFSMEVSSGIQYLPILTKLEDLKNTGVIDYAEPCLAEGHRI